MYFSFVGILLMLFLSFNMRCRLMVMVVNSDIFLFIELFSVWYRYYYCTSSIYVVVRNI